MSAIRVFKQISELLDTSFNGVANDDFLQRKAGAWSNRTIAQVKSDLGLTGTNSGDQTITLTGDVTASGTGSFAATLASTAVTPGSYTFSSITVDAKGRITAASNGTAFNGTVGATTPNTGAFTTIAASSTITGTQGTDATTAVYSVALATSTAATLNNQKWSPFLKQSANGWGTTASTSQDVSFDFGVQPVQGTVPTGNWVVRSNVAAAGWVTRLTIGTDGTVTIGASGPVLTPNIASTGSLSIKNGSTTSVWINANDVRLTSGLTVAWSSDATNAFNGTKDTYLGRQSAANLRQGAADAGSPVSQTFSVQNVATGNSNVAGVDRYIDGCQGTGSGPGGAIVFRTAPAGGSPTAQNALAAALTISGAGVVTFAQAAYSTSSTGGIGYATGAGGTVTQATSRTTGVTINKVCGSITLASAAGSASWQSFTVTNSAVAATDTIRVCQKSGTDKYLMSVTAVGAGSFEITYATTGGTTTEQPVFNFTVFKAVTA